MNPVSREEMYLYKLAGGTITLPTPVSRKEMYLAKACGAAVTVPIPVSREEMYLYKLAGGTITLPTPVSRLELLMAAACGEAVVPYDPINRLEWFWRQLSAPAQTITGVPPLTFISDGTALNSWIIYGNGQQSGTPTPDAPIMPIFCGTLSGSDWTIPITCAGQTTPVYLGQTQTVRRVKKLVLDGTEEWRLYSLYGATNVERFYLVVSKNAISPESIISTHFPTLTDDSDTEHIRLGGSPRKEVYIYISRTVATTVAEFKSYLASEYAAGHPVTVWYVLATPETAIVNEPLAKIGDYADELHSEDATVTIQTVSGSNTLTIGTTLQPSSVSITGNISQ